EEVLGDRPATFADLPRLRRCEWAIREALRIYPPVWILFTRKAVQNTELGGYAVPVGTWVYVFPWVVHRDARWYPEPERFDPERFSPGRVEQIPHYAWLPFGGGPHMCIGNTFAMMEMTLVIATVLQRFRIAPLNPGPAEPVPLMSLTPKG